MEIPNLFFIFASNKIYQNTMKRILAILSIAMASLIAFAQEGAWHGELVVQGTKLPLVFHFDADGCTMDSPNQGARGIKAEKSFTSDGKVKVEVPAIGASFEGFMVMNMITGTFTQGPVVLPLTLKPGEPKRNRPQTPKAPFPYKTEEVTFTNDGFTFHGTLTLPEGCSKDAPVLVMVTGSGQQNRDEELMDHKPFAVIADALAREGIATMRFDDRGYDDPAFPVLDFTVNDHAKDAEAGVALMRKRFNRVGVIGHSEGGTIALMLASEGKVDFCVSLAGMAVSGKETLLEQNRTTLSSIGLPKPDVDAYCDAIGKAFDDMAEGKAVEDVDDSKVPMVLKENFGLALQQLSTPYMRELLKHDVRASLSKVSCPVLALNGKRDTQVNWELNLDAIDKGLTNSKHEVVSMDDLNHLFQHCQTGLPNEYPMIEETFAPEALQMIVEWIKGL